MSDERMPVEPAAVICVLTGRQSHDIRAPGALAAVEATRVRDRNRPVIVESGNYLHKS